MNARRTAKLAGMPKIAWFATRSDCCAWSKAIVAGASNGIALPEGPEMRVISTPLVSK